MTTQQVANRYYELAKQNKWAEIWEELYSPEAVNREPEHAAARGIPTVTIGMDAIKAKSNALQGNDTGNTCPVLQRTGCRRYLF